MQSQMEAKLASMNLKSPGLKSNMPSSPSARTFNTSATNRQSLAFDSSSSFLSPDAANIVGNPGDAAATLAQQRAKLKAANNAAHRISAPALATSAAERGTWAGVASLGQVAERDNSPTQDILVEPRSSRPQSTDFSGLSGSPAFRPSRPDAGNSLDGLSPAIGDSWASMVNTPLLPIFQKSLTANNNATVYGGQTVDLAAVKLNDLYRGGGGNVSRLDGPEKFRRSFKGHIQHGSSGSSSVNNGVTNNGVYGDDGDLISGQHAPGVGRVQRASSRSGGGGGTLRNGGSSSSGAHSPALSNNSGRFGGSDDGGNAMAATHQQVALAGLGMGGSNLGLTSPTLDMPNGLSMAQLAQLNGMNGMNPFNMNMLGMANLSAMGISPEAQLLAAQIAAAGGGFGQPGLGLGGGLGGFAGMQQSSIGNSLRPGRSGGRSPGLGSANGKGGSAGGGNGNNSAKKDEEDFDPAVLNDVAGWLRTLRLHKYTPNFEGMTWKEMVMMDEQALEAQGVAALGARRKMLKTFEVVRRKMGIDDPNALPPPPPPSSGGPPPPPTGSASATSTTLNSVGTGSGGLPST